MSTPSAAKGPRGVDNYIDQVVRKEQFLESHPDVEVTTYPEASPHQRWHGQVPGLTPVTSGDLERLLDLLDHQVAARDAHTRWPRWTFTRSKGGWQAKETDGPELVFGRTMAEVEARVEQCERISGGTQPNQCLLPHLTSRCTDGRCGLDKGCLKTIFDSGVVCVLEDSAPKSLTSICLGFSSLPQRTLLGTFSQQRVTLASLRTVTQCLAEVWREIQAYPVNSRRG